MLVKFQVKTVSVGITSGRLLGFDFINAVGVGQWTADITDRITAVYCKQHSGLIDMGNGHAVIHRNAHPILFTLNEAGFFMIRQNK